MTTAESRPPVSVGESCPDFTLPAIDREETVSLADYRGRSPLFLALFIGLWCPFCRRSIAQMGTTEARLKAAGGRVTRSRGDDARERPPVLQVPPDSPPPGCRSRAEHASRVRAAEAGADTRADEGDRDDPDQPRRRAPRGAADPGGRGGPDRADGYAENETDKAEMERQWPQLKGQFLIDRDGIVRWANVECATEGLAGLGKFPSVEEILSAARAL